MYDRLTSQAEWQHKALCTQIYESPQEEFKANLSNIMRPFLKKIKQTRTEERVQQLEALARLER